MAKSPPGAGAAVDWFMGDLVGEPPLEVWAAWARRARAATYLTMVI